MQLVTLTEKAVMPPFPQKTAELLTACYKISRFSHSGFCSFDTDALCMQCPLGTSMSPMGLGYGSVCV